MANFIHKLWKAREEVLNILLLRKYIVPDEYRLSFEEFEEWAGDSSVIELFDAMKMEFETKKGKKIMVFWINKLNIILGSIVSSIEKKNCKNAIIVTNDGVTPQQKDNIRRYRKSQMYIDTFLVTELLFDPMNHHLVPLHEICSLDEKRHVMSQYAVTIKQLPQILLSDPIIRRIGAKKGQLIRITRESETQTGHKIISYRAVA